MKTLEIIMPHYTEDWSIVRPFFDMLSCQKGVDFSQMRVHLIHDGTDPFPKKNFSHVPCQVVQTKLPHKGVSATRNYGIDHADAKWVCFCDCDDTYASIYALRFVFEVLGTNDYDILWGGFVMESYGPEGIQLQPHDKLDLVWIHNKYYRLDFIKDNHLRFCEDLYMSEDSAFNAIANILTPASRIGHIKAPAPLYVWCYREGSVTLDKSRLLKNMEGHFDRNLYVLDKFREYNYQDADLQAGRTLTDAYVNLTRTDLPDGWEHFRDRVREFIIKEADALNRIKKDDLYRVLHASESEAETGGYLNPDRPALTNWIRIITRCKTG
jgi:glycosyltransferase involved in cell wall biosynthesis